MYSFCTILLYLMYLPPKPPLDHIVFHFSQIMRILEMESLYAQLL